MSPGWLKDNLFVVAALALPLVVVMFFLAATAIPRLLVDDPKYDLYFAAEQFNSQPSGYSLRFRVADGRLFADSSAYPAFYPSQTQKLYRFDADAGVVQRIDVEIPADIRQHLQEELETRQMPDRVGRPPAPPIGASAQAGFPVVSFVVRETENIKLRSETVAPDGYAFEGCCDGNRGLFGELFGMGARRANLRIAKSGRVIELENPEPEHRHRYQTGSGFLGWAER